MPLVIQDDRNKSREEKNQAYLDALHQYEVLRILDDHQLNLSGFLTGTWGELRALAKAAKHFMLCCLSQRPGVMEAFNAIELKLYPPGTDANKRFELYHCYWEECIWFVIAVPRKHRNLVTRIINENNMRVADGVPLIISGTSRHWFPIGSQYPWVCSLENAPGHAVYDASPFDIQDLLDAESKRVTSQSDKHYRERFWMNNKSPKTNNN